MTNIDPKTGASFGDEWSIFDHKSMPDHEAEKRFEEYFAVFPWGDLPANAEGFDMGCCSGRWARWVAPKVGHLHLIDPSDAIDVAQVGLVGHDNLTFHRAFADGQCLSLASQDFGNSLGVLHHVPDTQAAIHSCVDLLKPGAPSLLYLYYSFDNRNWCFRGLWRLSDMVLRLLCKLPSWLKHAVTDLIALVVYLPLVTFSRVLEWLGFNVAGVPLSYYLRYSFYTIRTDDCDRFEIPMEHRFTNSQISEIMDKAGLVSIRFSDGVPFWCVVGIKR